MSNLNNGVNPIIFDLKDKLNENSEQIAANLYEFKFDLYKGQNLLEDNYYRDQRDDYYFNDDFDTFEKVEKQMDELFEKFQKIKKDIHGVRLVKKYIEDKNKQMIDKLKIN